MVLRFTLYEALDGTFNLFKCKCSFHQRELSHLSYYEATNLFKVFPRKLAAAYFIFWNYIFRGSMQSRNNLQMSSIKALIISSEHRRRRASNLGAAVQILPDCVRRFGDQ